MRKYLQNPIVVGCLSIVAIAYLYFTVVSPNMKSSIADSETYVEFSTDAPEVQEVEVQSIVQVSKPKTENIIFPQTWSYSKTRDPFRHHTRKNSMQLQKKKHHSSKSPRRKNSQAKLSKQNMQAIAIGPQKSGVLVQGKIINLINQKFSKLPSSVIYNSSNNKKIFTFSPKKSNESK